MQLQRWNRRGRSGLTTSKSGACSVESFSGVPLRHRHLRALVFFLSQTDTSIPPFETIITCYHDCGCISSPLIEICSPKSFNAGCGQLKNGDIHLNIRYLIEHCFLI